MSSPQALFPIGEVANITGIKPITLRAWERRYGLIEPVRTEGGHRLYTQQHIDTIQSAIQLTETGVPIGQAKKLIEQAETAIPNELDENYDYAKQLETALAEQDLALLHSELDQLFADTPDSLQNQILCQQTLKLDANNALQDTLWQSDLLPRLYTRLRLLTRNLSAAKHNKFLIQANRAEENPVMVLLVAIQFARKGILPIINSHSELEPDTLFQLIKQMHCEGLVLIDSSQSFDETLWGIWTDVHSSIELHYCLNENQPPQLSKKLQCYYHHLNGAFFLE